ncbi:hypothetical protein BBUBOL26_H10 (plasmid) [Borreliella burgdorferi Bol26]|nr:hypothetical protein BBUBOL26_H10 [Borreliella burgdorferi Bol26]
MLKLFVNKIFEFLNKKILNNISKIKNYKNRFLLYPAIAF